MSAGQGEPMDKPSLVKEALLQLRDLRSRLEESEARFTAPIAVVGLACRFPGAPDPAAYWRLLRQGVDGVGPIPLDRWDIDAFYDADPDAPGRMYTRHGGFIDGADLFDPHVFGISPREAAAMDPQHRLLLEVGLEAMEDAGISSDSLMGRRAGVFVGLSNSDYLRLQFAELESVDAYAALGVNYSVAAGRLSYWMGLRGPSMVVDTACSSSLVAVHLACQSLRAGESAMALVGGVNLVLLPEINVNFCKARMLAADGRCKTFDAGADGYVRGEGCGVVVLKRLADALEDGDRVRCVIRGSAVNQDGRSSGLTVPNGPAQEDVIRTAVANAGLETRDIDYVEAHGTGTSLGDPIELSALQVALGPGRDAGHPLLVGSVKTNIGHLEAAAGLAGLIKVVLALEHEEIPSQLHFETPNPHFDWSSSQIEIVKRPRPWEARNGRRIAGVSSFGFSGTNAHVIVEQAPVRPSVEPLARPWHCLSVSGSNDSAMAASATRLAGHLRENPLLSLPDVALTMNAGRAHRAERAVVVVASVGEAVARLDALGRGTTADTARGSAVPGVAPDVVFLFPGQGAHYGGMAAQLFETSVVVREALTRCDAILAGKLARPLLELVFDTDERALETTSLAQPALFAVEYALAELWRSWGVRPATVLGHSAGEVAAACVAGAMDLEGALRFMVERGRLMQSVPAGGAMATVFAPIADVETALARQGEGVGIAAINGPANVVVTGRAPAVEALAAEFETAGVRAKRLRISNAFHSPLVEPILPDLERAAAAASYRASEVEIVSNLTGKALGARELGPSYWRDHVRRPVQFLDSLRVVDRPENKVFLEVGPGSTLIGIAQEAIDAEGRQFLPTIRRSRDEWQQILETAAALHVQGVPIDWAAVDRPYARGRVSLPTYPFERQRYWSEPRQRREPSASESRWDIAERAGTLQASQAPLDLALPRFSAVWEAFAQLTTAYEIQALRELGAFATPGARATAPEVCDRHGVGATHLPLIRRWLDHLAAEGHLRAEGDAFVADRELKAVEPERVLDERKHDLSAYPEFLEYVKSCGARAAAVLTGKESALDTLFPGGSFALAEGLYRTSAVSRYLNGIVAAVAGAAVRASASGADVRVLEIGAGTGGTTAAVLPVLPAERSIYCFTDLSDYFFARAQEAFESFPFVRYERLDIEEDPGPQGFAPASFDLIVAANVLHATRDLRKTLLRVRSLLAPGGLLILSESTIHHRVYDVTTGLIEGWEIFEDDLRSDNPLVTEDVWLKLLLEVGFEHARAFPDVGGPADALGNRILAAAAPTTGQRSSVREQGRESVARSGPAPTRRKTAGPDEALLVALGDGLPDERRALLSEAVRERVMRVLRLDEAHKPSLAARLIDLGLDSLMAVQLRNELGTALGLAKKLPATLVFDHPSCEAIGAFLDETMFGAGLTGTRPAAPEPKAAIEALPKSAVADLSEAEAEELLLKRLESIEAKNP